MNQISLSLLDNLRGITPLWIFSVLFCQNMCRQTLHLMLTWNLLRTDGNVTVQSKVDIYIGTKHQSVMSLQIYTTFHLGIGFLIKLAQSNCVT